MSAVPAMPQMPQMPYSDAVVRTCGHGNRSGAELVDLLAAHGIRTLVDIRARPLSRRNPQFNREALRELLAGAGIQYRWAGRHLGGMREPSSDSRHVALPADTLRGYADHMESAAFRRAADQLVSLARLAPTAVMCAERLPRACHRSLLSDYLILGGAIVQHLIEADRAVDHLLHENARRESVELIYDRLCQQILL